MKEREKYATWPRYYGALATRAALRGLLRLTAYWRPLSEPAEGYTVVVGVPWQLWPLVDIPLRSLQRAARRHCCEVLLAVDTTIPAFQKAYGGTALEEKLAEFADVHPRALFYNPLQQLISRMIRWNWVDCWLTWSLGVAEAGTRHVLLHDFDAVVIDPAFLDRHYLKARDEGLAFLGICADPCYEGYHGQTVLMTIELLADAAALRSRFAPVDLFNRVRMWDGARIECDIFRDVQLRMGTERSAVHATPGMQIVHPTQMVSQWHQLQRSRQAFRPSPSTPLFFIPYFRYLGGAKDAMAQLTESLEAGQTHVMLEGKTLDVSGLDAAGRAWIGTQLRQLESYFASAPRDEVIRYAEAIERRERPAARLQAAS